MGTHDYMATIFLSFYRAYTERHCNNISIPLSFFLRVLAVRVIEYCSCLRSRKMKCLTYTSIGENYWFEVYCYSRLSVLIVEIILNVYKGFVVICYSMT